MHRLLCLTIALTPAWAQPRDNQDRTLACNDGWGDRRMESSCEIREQTLPASGRLDVDGRQSGGVTVRM